MAQSTKVSYRGGMAFDVELQGHRLVIDAAAEQGGQDLGPRPKALLLPALAGCTGMDVVAILRKMRVPFEGLTVEVTGEQRDEHPRIFERLHVVYRVSGKDVDRAKVERAVELSQTTYCGVTAMLERAATVTHEIVLDSDQPRG